MKKTPPLPPQVEPLMSNIMKHISEEKYFHSLHAFDKVKERSIGLLDVLFVLETGRHESEKTRFDDKHRTWNYAIRGETEDRAENIRVIVAFDKNEMIIVTVFPVKK